MLGSLEQERADAFLRHYQVVDQWPGMFGALQERRALIRGVRTNALEVTFETDDIAAALARAEAHGGTTLMPPYQA